MSIFLLYIEGNKFIATINNFNNNLKIYTMQTKEEILMALIMGNFAAITNANEVLTNKEFTDNVNLKTALKGLKDYCDKGKSEAETTAKVQNELLTFLTTFAPVYNEKTTLHTLPIAMQGIKTKKQLIEFINLNLFGKIENSKTTSTNTGGANIVRNNNGDFSAEARFYTAILEAGTNGISAKELREHEYIVNCASCTKGSNFGWYLSTGLIKNGGVHLNRTKTKNPDNTDKVVLQNERYYIRKFAPVIM